MLAIVARMTHQHPLWLVFANRWSKLEQWQRRYWLSIPGNFRPSLSFSLEQKLQPMKCKKTNWERAILKCFTFLRSRDANASQVSFSVCIQLQESLHWRSSTHLRGWIHFALRLDPSIAVGGFDDFVGRGLHVFFHFRVAESSPD